jgi:hypothetical protein
MSMNLELGDSEDDLAAVASFHDWAQNLGYKTTLRPDGKAVGVRGRYGFDLHFRNIPGMKRLIMRCYFPSNPDRADMPGRFALANQINSSFNIGTFWFDADADFACQFVLPFQDRLTPALWREFFSFSESGVTQIIQQHAEDFRPFMA